MVCSRNAEWLYDGMTTEIAPARREERT